MEMKTKNLMVFFLAILSVLSVVATVSATKTELANVEFVKVNSMIVDSSEGISVIAGDTLTVQIAFKALETAQDVKFKAEIEGEKIDVSEKTAPFNVEAGSRYVKTLTIKVPYELKDVVSENVELSWELYNKDYETTNFTDLDVQREAYKTSVMSISTNQRVSAGETMSIDVVLKNTGYNYLDDMYVTARIPSLGVEKTVYFGDLSSVDNCKDSIFCDAEDYDDEERDTERARFYLTVPYGAEAGIYTLEVEAKNSDLTTTEVKQFVVENDFSAGNVMVTSSSKTVSAGEEAVYNLLVVNPTNKLKVYTVSVDSSGSLSTDLESTMVAVPAGSSATVSLTAQSKTQGEYAFTANVFSGNELVSSVPLTTTVEGTSFTSPVAVLTIILAVIFIVLLIVLIVLVGKKPAKSEEFGESYY